MHLGTLAGGLGCCPLDDGASPPPSHSQGWSPGIGGLVGVGKLTPPDPSSALPPGTDAVALATIPQGCPSRHFGENQLSPSSIGISPLPATHPMALPRQRVRAFSPG